MLSDLIISPTFEEFVGVQKNLELMLKYAARRVGAEKADDMVQDACLRLMSHWGAVLSNPQSSRYITMTLDSAIKDFWRKDNRHRKAVGEVDLSIIPDDFSLEAEVFSRLALEEIFAEASDAERPILFGRLLGYTSREIAEQLDKPKATVESQLQRFRKRFRNKKL
jgi:RNA polymerase sigma factor (sigma-70 family)